MPARSRSVHRLVAERSKQGAAAARFVDMRLELLAPDCAVVSRFGGRWDRLAKQHVDGIETARVVTLHEGQLEAAQWFDGWIGHHLAGDNEPKEKVYDCLLAGGRRGGKTAFALLAAIGYALTVAGALVWIVCPSDAFYGEPTDYLESIMPRDWYHAIGMPHPRWFLANGSEIALLSGHTPRNLKLGKADFVVIQEGQAVPTPSYTKLSGSVIDTSGLILSTANPPDLGDPGEWVTALATAAQQGTNPHARYFFFDPERNPHIDVVALRALAQKMDQHTYDTQVRGMFLVAPDAVLSSWDQQANEVPAPQMGDCTREFTKFFEGREYDDIVGVDVQKFPWIAGVRFRAFRNPLAPTDMAGAFIWGVGEVFLEHGDELDFARELELSTFRGQRCAPDRTLVVADASGDWQQQQRNEEWQRAQFRGKGSFDVLRGAGFVHVVPPDPDMRGNPDVIERCRAANARIRTAVHGNEAPGRFVFLDPACKQTIASVRGWRARSGRPSRTQRAAHGGDAFTYVIWRFFPRRETKRDIEITTKFGGRRFEGYRRLPGWGG